MATKKTQTTKTESAAPTVEAAPAAEGKPKKARSLMTLAQKFELMQLVKSYYATLGLTDIEFAKAATEKLGFRVLPATVGNYRTEFGIAAHKAATVAELRARIAELEAQLAEAQSEV